MIANVGTIDRILRAALGVALIYLGVFSGLPLFDTGPWAFAAVAVGAVMLVVAATRVCPVYAVLGLRTCRT